MTDKPADPVLRAQLDELALRRRGTSASWQLAVANQEARFADERPDLPLDARITARMQDFLSPHP